MARDEDEKAPTFQIAEDLFTHPGAVDQLSVSSLAALETDEKV